MRHPDAGRHLGRRWRRYSAVAGRKTLPSAARARPRDTHLRCKELTRRVSGCGRHWRVGRVLSPAGSGTAIAATGRVGPRLLQVRLVTCLLFATLCSTARLSASPAMIRLGYAGCQACHLAPQGRGLLTEYGKGIDDAQSARHGVYDADEDRWRRLFQDVRLMTQVTSEAREQPERATSAALRLWYRNTTRLSHMFRVSGAVSVDAPAACPGSHDAAAAAVAAPGVRATGSLRDHATQERYVAIGRDTLPSGVEIADQATYMRARNGQGLTDVPTQAKLFWSTERFQVAPYVYGPSGQEAPGFRSSGGGSLPNSTCSAIASPPVSRCAWRATRPSTNV